MQNGNVGIKIQRLKDFGLVAALVTKNFPLLTTEKDIRTVYFVFRHTQELEQAIAEYRANKLVVYARQYFENTKMLKSIIYSEVSNGS